MENVDTFIVVTNCVRFCLIYF